MIATRNHRIVRRTLLAVVVMMLLPVGYVASLLSVAFFCGAGWLSPAAAHVLSPAYAPLELYMRCEAAGGAELFDAIQWINEAGSRFAM